MNFHTPPDIRRATLEDVPALTSLAIQLGYPNTVDEISHRLKRINSNGEKLLVAVNADDLPIAFEHLRVTQSLVAPDVLEIAALVVDSDFSGTGIGTELVKAAEALACSLGLSTIQLRTNIRRQEAHIFDERLGFEKNNYGFKKQI